MADDRSGVPAFERNPPRASLATTRTESGELSRGLDALRDRYEVELSERLRDARAYGSPGDNEVVFAVHEEASVLAARIARLEELLRSAPISDGAFDGRVSLGCTVHVAVPGGRVAEYVVVGRRSGSPSPREVSAGSSVGHALLGASPGQAVRVELADGRSRELRVVRAMPPAGMARAVAAEAGVEAA
jgi:transcription elongation factor GreA